MKLKLAVTIVLVLSILANTVCVTVDAVKKPTPTTVHYSPSARMAMEYDRDSKDADYKAPAPVAVSAPAPVVRVLKQVTPGDMAALDLSKPCGFTADELESVTKFNLCGLGAAFAAQDSKVNAVFLLAVAALESGWGRYKLTQYNLFGMYHYTPQSYTECITHVADCLQANYLRQGGDWYNGVTVTAVNTQYCVNTDGSPNTAWAAQVSEIMAQMYNQIYLTQFQSAI